MASAAPGETLYTASFDSPIGEMLVASTARGLAYLKLPRASGQGFRGWLARAAADAGVEEAFAPNRSAITQVVEYLEGKRESFELELDIRGTPFQQSVYAALLEIPYGETRSYAEIAKRVGRPRAVRAVGTANGANPISLVVPCHRVVNTGGKLGGYGGGLALKQRLLAMEGSHPSEDRLL